MDHPDKMIVVNEHDCDIGRGTILRMQLKVQYLVVSYIIIRKEKNRNLYLAFFIIHCLIYDFRC